VPLTAIDPETILRLWAQKWAQNCPCMPRIPMASYGSFLQILSYDWI